MTPAAVTTTAGRIEAHETWPVTEQFSANGFEVTVTESPGELRYAFAGSGGRTADLPVANFFWWFNLVLLGVGGAVVYALLKAGAGQPDWVVALSWLFAGQTLAMAGLGLVVLVRRYALASAWRHRRMEMAFTREAFHHRTGGEFDGPVCPLAAVRGFRVFLSGQGDDRLGALSVVIGNDRQTHGIFGASDAEDMVTLAEHLHRRLAAFRRACGVRSPFDPVEVVETTEAEAAERSHTVPPRPAGGLARQLLWRGYWALAAFPALCTVWGLAVVAGVVGSGVLLVSAGLGPVLIGTGFVGLFHAVMVFAAWKLRPGRPAVG